MGGQYEVEKILGKRSKGGIEEYKVKWKGYDLSECTWEPEVNLSSCRQLLQEFKEKHRNLNNKNIARAAVPKIPTGKTYKSREPEKPSMKKKPVDDDDFFREEDQNEEQEEQQEIKSPQKLKRPGQKLVTPSAQPKKSLKRVERGTNGAGPKRTEPSDQEEQGVEVCSPEQTLPDVNNNNKLGETGREIDKIQVIAMYSNETKGFCYKVKENGNTFIIDRQKLLAKDPLALVVFYESNIKISMK